MMWSRHRPGGSSVLRWRLGLSAAVILLGLLARPAGAQNEPGGSEILYSTEEDFLTFGPEPPDGNPIISDGDLLAVNFPGLGGCRVVARNAQLLQVFQSRFDLGLDAALVLDPDPDSFLVAFSTSLDDPQGRFTAGDLLVTNGVIIPNRILLANFQSVPPELNLGLDALECRGDPKRCAEFFRSLDGPIDDPGVFFARLQEFGIDILFSTEGTGPTPLAPDFLDGDLLSAAAGAVVIPNSVLLNLLPAGIPADGVDYGLDAFTIGQRRIGFLPPGATLLPNDIVLTAAPVVLPVHLLSTELVSIDRPIQFTDGDVLRAGPSVFLKNNDLIFCWEPRVRDLGLDALHFGRFVQRDCEITRICNISVNDIDPLTGLAIKDPCFSPPQLGPADRPFGRHVFIYGNINFNPLTHEYRIVAEDLTNATEAPILPACAGEYRVRTGSCVSIVPFLATGSDGWIDLNLYDEAHACNPLVPLNIWNSRLESDGLYNLRLEVRQKPDGPVICVDTQRVRIDNTPPDCVLNVPLNFSGTSLPITGQVSDEHFRSYSISAFGCNPPGPPPPTPNSACYDDPGNPAISPTGTVGVVTITTLNLPCELPRACGIGVSLRVEDRTCRGLCRTPAFPPNAESLLYPALAQGNLRFCSDAFCLLECTDNTPVPLEPERFRRGDANSDTGVDITDGIVILGFLFLGEREPACLKSADVDDNGLVDISDASFLFEGLFGRGRLPPGPFPSCGIDPTPDRLHCDTYTACFR